MADHHGPEDFKKSLFEKMRKTEKTVEELQRAQKMFEETMAPNIELGKQNIFTEGKYGPEDEGALAFAVGSDRNNKKVFIDFKTPVSWFAMSPEQAMHLAQHLTEHAKRIAKKPLTIKV